VNWFERYGIPGLYFVGLLAGWLYAFYPQIICSNTLPGLIAALIAISLPIGYILSIIGQTLYLKLKWLGVHGAATDRVNKETGRLNCDDSTRDEAVIEARTLLLTTRGPFLDPIKTHKYMRDWIARRMDVIAINQSLIVATVFSWFITIVIWISQGGLTVILPLSS